MDAETEVVLKTSPESVVQQKAREIADIGPGGWRKALVYAAVCMPLWLTSAAQLAWALVTRPMDVLRRPDPAAFKLTPPFPLHEEYLTVNGIKLHAVSPGRQPGKPLMLMLHGFPECWYSWRHQMAAFAKDYDVVAIDMRGYNTSDKPQGVGNYRLDILASDVKGAVAALGHSTCTLVAHDWGGGVAWVTAGMYGSELIDRLIVIGLPHLGISSTNMNNAQYVRSLYMLTFQAPWLPEKTFTIGNASIMSKAFVDSPMGVRNAGAFTDQDLSWYRQAFCQPGAATATLNYYRALVRWQLFADRDDPAWRAVRRQLEMPVLVLHGDSDVALGVELLDGIEAVAPHSTVKVLKNCSHWIQQDYPGLVTRLLKDWLAAH